MRAIDCGELEKRISSLARLARSDAQKSLLGRVLYIVENMPTLTPPNGPLTWNEFAEMEGQPVYIVEMGARRYWALVIYVDKDTAYFATLNDPDDYGDKELYGESWVAYRRPLEGEA